MVQNNKYSAGNYGSRWLQATQISSHGSFEFRGLEGTLDPVVFKNYGLLLNRLIQAARLGKPWGVKMHSIQPIAITADSILAFFKFLDITRPNISPDLKTMRDWYLSRVHEFRERESFTQHLINNPKFVPLRALRETGKHHNHTMFSQPIETKTFTDKELGIKIRQVYDRVLASCSPNRLYLNEPLAPAMYLRLASMPREMGLVDNPQGDGVPEYDCDEAYMLRDREGPFRAVLLDENNQCPMISEFCDAIFSGSHEDLGKWYRTRCCDPQGRPLSVNVEAFCYILRAWLRLWAAGRPSHAATLIAFSTGDTSCVDF